MHNRFALEQASPRGGVTRARAVPAPLRLPRYGSAVGDDVQTPVFVNSAVAGLDGVSIEDVAKKHGVSVEQLRELAKKNNIDLSKPGELEDISKLLAKDSNLLDFAKGIFGGDKTADKTEKAAQTSKPRTKEEAQQTLTARAAVALGAGAAVGVGVGLLTKKPVWGVVAGVGAFGAAAVVYQVADPLSSDDLDKAFKSDDEPKKGDEKK